MKHYSTKELLEASNKVPLLIQVALSSEVTITTISNLTTNLKLHIDKVGLIAELNVQMLLGLISPQEFLQELVANGIPDAQARQIMDEINTKIFVPLREQMRNAPAPRPQPVNAPVPNYASNAGVSNKVQGAILPQIPQRQPVPLKPYPLPLTPAPANSTPKFAHQENRIAPLPPKFGTARPILTAPPMPTSGEKLLENHEEPHIDIRDKVQVRTAPPPANLPGAMTSPVMSTPRPVTPPAPVRPPYSSDPYREQIDGK